MRKIRFQDVLKIWAVFVVVWAVIVIVWAVVLID